ncbi:MAG: DUF4304 domain-containing protein [Pseudomonadota bacterium]
MSETNIIINNLISHTFKQFFKKEGYKKSGIDFIKKEDSIIKIVNFWPSHSSFTVSLGIFFPALNNYMITKHMENTPKRVADCHIQQQNLGFLSDAKKAIWWDLYDRANVIDLEKLSKEVFDLFTKHGLPWLNGCNNYDQALDYLLDRKAYSLFPPFAIPALYLVLGKRKDAINSLKAIYNDYEKAYSDEELKDYRGAMESITKVHNEFANKNNLEIQFLNKFNK